MLTKEENELLCRVEGDAPAGQLMRRYWIPAFMLEEVAEPDGTPLRVKLLGEDLIAFPSTPSSPGNGMPISIHGPARQKPLDA